MAVTNDVTLDSRVLHEARTLRDAGFQVTIIGVQGRSRVSDEMIDGLHVQRVPPGPAGSFFALSVRNKMKYIDAFIRYGGVAQKRMYPALIQSGADIFHAHDLDTLQIVERAARFTGKPFAYDSHEIFTETVTQASNKTIPVRVAIWFAQRWYRKIERSLIRHATAVLTVNVSLADWFRTLYSIEQPTVIMNAPDLVQFSEVRPLRDMLHLAEMTKTILYQGTYRAGVGILPLLESVVHWDSDLHLVMIGYGPLETRMKQTIDRLHINERVTLLGPVSPNRLLSFTVGADIGVVPVESVNVSKKLSFANKFFEFMSAGIPVIASDLPENRRMIEDTKCGILFPTLEPRDIAATINAFSKNPERQAMGRRGRMAAETRFNWSIESKKLVVLYQRITLPDRRAL